MKEHHQMQISQEQPAIQLRPIISYPRVAEIGETYLLTIDVQLAPDSPWPYQEEEFEISFLLETAPFFTYETLGPHEPGIVLHRFGGTYGAAEYLLKASEQKVTMGHIKIVLLNGWGLPIAQLKLDCEVRQGVLKGATKQIQLKASEVVDPAVKTNEVSQDKQESDVLLTRQKQLSATIRSVRDLLRRDDGLAYETDRLSHLVWLLFLKNLDDFEESQEELLGDDFVPILKKDYRWRDWVVAESLTHQRQGDELLKFVNDDLFPYLATLGNEDNQDIRTIIGTVFRGTYNRIRSGYILREVANKLSTIDFNLSTDVYASSDIYEILLKQVSDSSGDTGEFYTPRPIVRFIIDRLKPQLGESILDPACGTAGFLVEAYTRLIDRVQTPEQLKQLQDHLIGVEKKPMPYLLGITNMLLHGIKSPNVIEGNALTTDIRYLQDNDSVDIIATNPPFGGKEEHRISYNFPVRTVDTSLLFVQYIMSTLKPRGGRCAIVLPNGFLFGQGVTGQIKLQLLADFNLHTIVRLPKGVFSPYTSLPTNILFFESNQDLYDVERGSSTTDVWYYEIPLPEGRTSYTKTKPIQDEDFLDCLAWWDHRQENEHAWKVTIEQLEANDWNLDFKNPRHSGNV